MEAIQNFFANNAQIMTLIVYGLIIVAIWFFLFRPQSKKRKQEQEMRNNVSIGDEITTIGGIVGRVVSVKEETETIILETGVDRSKIQIKKWAISTNDTANAENKDKNDKDKK